MLPKKQMNNSGSHKEGVSELMMVMVTKYRFLPITFFVDSYRMAYYDLVRPKVIKLKVNV
jgi:hypothetical protein